MFALPWVRSSLLKPHVLRFNSVIESQKDLLARKETMVTTGLLQISNHVTNTLNTLINNCEDGQKGYADASEAANSSRLKSFFQKQEQERSQFSSKLQELVERYGGEAEKSGSIQGALHRAWLITRDKLSPDGEKLLLEECIRGDQIALEAYDNALEKELPFDVNQIVFKQRLAIENTKVFLKDYVGKQKN